MQCAVELTMVLQFILKTVGPSVAEHFGLAHRLESRLQILNAGELLSLRLFEVGNPSRALLVRFLQRIVVLVELCIGDARTVQLDAQIFDGIGHRSYLGIVFPMEIHQLLIVVAHQLLVLPVAGVSEVEAQDEEGGDGHEGDRGVVEVQEARDQTEDDGHGNEHQL